MNSFLNRKIPVWTHAVATIIALLVIQIIFDSHYVAWLIGFAPVGFLSQLAYVPPAKRSVWRFVLATVLPGIAAVLTVTLFKNMEW